MKPSTAQNKLVTEFIMGEGTMNDILSLYLLYLRAEQEKKKALMEECQFLYILLIALVIMIVKENAQI